MDKTVLARERFLADGDVSLARPEITASWQRSMIASVDPDLDAAPLARDSPAPGRLVEVAGPVLAGMAEMLVGEPVAMTLSDELGRIIWRWAGQPRIRRLLDRHAVDCGFDFGEQAIGTNAVGTALELNRPVVVHAGEHFLESFNEFTCAAAPIRGLGNRRVRGVLNIACASSANHFLLRPTLLRLVTEVEAQLLDGVAHDEKVLLQTFQAERQRGHKPVISIGEDVMFANRAASRLDFEQEVLWARARAALTTAGDAEFRLPEHESLVLRGREIRVGSRLLGLLLIVDNDGATRRSAPTSVATEFEESPALAVCRQRIREAFDNSLPLLVRGERGVGKFRLVEDVAADLGRRVLTVDAADAYIETPSEWMARLVEAVATDAVVVIRHLEALPSELATTAGSVLRASANPAASLVGNWTMGDGVPRNELVSLLGAVHVIVPPLRERTSEIPEILDELVTRNSQPPYPWFSRSAIARMSRNAWEGNIIEMEGVVRTVLARRGSGEIIPNDLPEEIGSDHRWLSPLEWSESRLIRKTLEQHNGNKSHAATALGISRTTLYRKIRSYGIDA